MQQPQSEPRVPNRLGALEYVQLLETPLAGAFDCLTRLAYRVLRVQAAAVMLVGEDRQFLKSAIGIPEPWSSRGQMPIAYSYCRHTVETGRPVVVSDARVHPSLKDSPSVEEHGWIAYIGVPLVVADGCAIGTLCVFDGQPRTWTGEEVEVITTLAAAVMTEIESRMLALRLGNARRYIAIVDRERLIKTALLNGTQEGIYGIDRRGLGTFLNSAGAKLLGYTPGELISRNVHQLIHPRRRDGTIYPERQSAVLRALNRGAGVHRSEEIFWRRDGSSFLGELSSSPIRDGEALLGAVVRFTDLTQRKRTEEALRMAERFNYVVHELRTPLHAVALSADLLDAGIPDPVPAGARRQVGRIIRSVAHLLQLVDHMLEFSRIYTGVERVEIEPVKLDLLVDEIVTIVEPLTQSKGLELEVSIDGGGATLETDAGKVRQILINLLGNAIKSTSRGTISLRAWQEDRVVFFEVQDTGEGIAPEDLRFVFQPFWQAERGRAGTGMGLFLSRKLAQLMGGDITARSQPTRGSVFTVHLAARPAAAEVA
jgi:PAS domain S-box-containing protein